MVPGPIGTRATVAVLIASSWPGAVLPDEQESFYCPSMMNGDAGLGLAWLGIFSLVQ